MTRCFHPVAGNEAVATASGQAPSAAHCAFPSRCRARGGCNCVRRAGRSWRDSVSIPLPGARRLQRARRFARQHAGKGFHPVAGRAMGATQAWVQRLPGGPKFPSRRREPGQYNRAWLDRARCPGLQVSIPLPGTRRLQPRRTPTPSFRCYGFHPVAGNEVVAT